METFVDVLWCSAVWWRGGSVLRGGEWSTVGIFLGKAGKMEIGRGYSQMEVGRPTPFPNKSGGACAAPVVRCAVWLTGWAQSSRNSSRVLPVGPGRLAFATGSELDTLQKNKGGARTCVVLQHPFG